MEITKTKRTREEVRAAFRETMRRGKKRMEEKSEKNGRTGATRLFCITKESSPKKTTQICLWP